MSSIFQNHQFCFVANPFSKSACITDVEHRIMLAPYQKSFLSDFRKRHICPIQLQILQQLQLLLPVHIKENLPYSRMSLQMNAGIVNGG